MAFKMRGAPYKNVGYTKEGPKSAVFQKTTDKNDVVKKKEKELGRKLTRSEIEDLFSQMNPNNPEKD